jgi:hypothetical protein
MTSRIQYIGCFIGLAIVLFAINSFFENRYSSNSQKLFERDSVNSIQIQRGIVRLDLKNFNHLSDAVASEIAVSIDSAYSKYAVSPILLHAIFRIECEYVFWVTHPTVTIKIRGKMVTTNAIGLGGIIWEIWGEDLTRNGIASTKSDLYRPSVNVMATAYIVRRIITDNISINTNTHNILPILISRYYGQFDKNYEQKMRIVMSDLFWKLISQDLAKPNDTTKVVHR